MTTRYIYTATKYGSEEVVVETLAELMRLICECGYDLGNLRERGDGQVEDGEGDVIAELDDPEAPVA